MGKTVMRNPGLELGVKIFDLYKDLVFSQREFVISKRVLKSGIETCSFMKNREIKEAYKMAVETDFWIEMLKTNNQNKRVKQNEKIRSVSEQLHNTMRFLEMNM